MDMKIDTKRCRNCRDFDTQTNIEPCMSCVDFGNWTPVPTASDTPKPAKGLKYDEGKQNWYALPLVLLEPLADVFRAGEFKYETFNCLEPFEDSDRRFYDGQMRHTRDSQMNPLAIDEELMEKYGQKVYHQAQIAFNALLRLHNALRNQEEKEEVKLTEEELTSAWKALGKQEAKWDREKLWDGASKDRNLTTYSSVFTAPERFKP